MKYISVQPAIPYYTWQVEVMINNFMDMGINPNDIEILCSYRGSIPEVWSKLANHYNYVRFFFYEDTRKGSAYISSIRPHILEKHWTAFPQLEKEVIFYHDCDIMMAKQVDFSHLVNDDICYVSDTKSYIGAAYIRSKGEQYLDRMAGIVGIDKQTLIDNEKDSGGAQYILKNITAKFWKKVYRDSEKLWIRVNKMIADEKPHHALQIWCADMWALLWNLWVSGKEVRVVDDLNFSWGTSSMKEWDSHPIYHNAGVTGKGDMFYKAQYKDTLPYKDIDLTKLSPDKCSFNYATHVVNVGTKSCLL